ncbi:hypothetical protein CEXT_70601 [Caerostris extrusa]|uniref:Uncharacterized protein n=1 Tax=Caerostris extrusa TaxID=172846 RepID=A0AAV4M3Y1_CAEEX|nr:hypothetical protein CEXT_70601 [Caerostris extrusa]
MKYTAVKIKPLIHTLFDGVENHQSIWDTEFLSDFRWNYGCSCNVLDSDKICSEIYQIATFFWLKELKDNGIHLMNREYFHLSHPLFTRILVLI